MHHRPGLSVLTLIALTALTFAVVPAAGSAQMPTAVSEGVTSISFGIDGSGTAEAGAWIFVTDRANLGLLGRVDWISEDREPPRLDRRQLTIGLGPRLKWYIPVGPRVAPFWYGGLEFTHSSVRDEGQTEETSSGVGVDGGFGVDWFPVDQISIGGWTGLRLSSDRQTNDDVTTRLRSLTTGLRMHVYF